MVDSDTRDTARKLTDKYLRYGAPLKGTYDSLLDELTELVHLRVQSSLKNYDAAKSTLDTWVEDCVQWGIKDARRITGQGLIGYKETGARKRGGDTEIPTLAVNEKRLTSLGMPNDGARDSTLDYAPEDAPGRDCDPNSPFAPIYDKQSTSRADRGWDESHVDHTEDYKQVSAAFSRYHTDTLPKMEGTHWIQLARNRLKDSLPFDIAEALGTTLAGARDWMRRNPAQCERFRAQLAGEPIPNDDELEDWYRARELDRAKEIARQMETCEEARAAAVAATSRQRELQRAAKLPGVIALQDHYKDDLREFMTLLMEMTQPGKLPIKKYQIRTRMDQWEKCLANYPPEVEEFEPGHTFKTLNKRHKLVRDGLALIPEFRKNHGFRLAGKHRPRRLGSI